jgi:hypothetical protein
MPGWPGTLRLADARAGRATPVQRLSQIDKTRASQIGTLRSSFNFPFEDPQ